MGNTSEDANTDLSGLDDAQIAELFRQRRHDLRFLDVLSEELKRRKSDDALSLHFDVNMARRALLRAATPSVVQAGSPSSSPVRDWLSSFFRARMMPRSDGRPLYRYRMTDGEYARAKEILRHLMHKGRLVHPDERAGALFVAYCAEWFRRESDSTFLRWDDPAPDLLPSVPYASKQQLTSFGLKYWGRPLRKSANAREFLLTVALEGGFPVRILAEAAHGWLKEYLRAIMRQATFRHAYTHDEILAIGEEERGRMRKSYQHDDFVALCSELVWNLLILRRKAETEGPGGIRNSALLDTTQPGWRDELPIYVPVEDQALVTELLTGLLDEKMTGLATEGVEARRFLVKTDDEWRTAVLLLADGEVPPNRLPVLPVQGRVRAIATGELSNFLAGELALLEPPVGEQRRWRVRPFMRVAKLLAGFPFGASVTTILTSPDGTPHPWTWPRGEALRSDVLVFEQDESSTPQEPMLRFLRSGSVSSPLKTLYALVPQDWVVEPATEGAVAQVEAIPSLGRQLVMLTGAAYFHSAETDSDRFRVEPDTDGREREIEFTHVGDAGFVVADERWELVATPVSPMIREAGKPRPSKEGELFVRRPGGKWAPLSVPLAGGGLMELSWRDPVANVQIEKRLLALLPGNARVRGVMKDAVTGEIHLQNLPGWTAAIHEISCSVEAVNASVLSIRFTGRPVYRLPMSLRPPGGQPFDVVVPLIGREAVVAVANGSILSPGALMDVGALRGAVIVSPRKTVAHLVAKGSKSSGLKVVVDGELPLGILRSAIDETLATLRDQDDLVELEFIGDTRRPIRISRYRHGQLQLDGERVRWHAASESHAVYPVARMVLDPRHEHALEPDGEEFWRIPERCKGVCLVYLRDMVDVVSRPVSVARSGNPNVYAGNLAAAMLVSDHEERQRSIESAIALLGRGGNQPDDQNWLLDAVTNLNNLPASAYDVLKQLPSSPEVLVQLLLCDRDRGERDSIWKLQNELPFLWLALPLRAWRVAIEQTCTVLAHALKDARGEQEAMEFAVARLRNVCDELIALEPALATTLGIVGMPGAHTIDIPSLKDLTNGYVRVQHQRGGDEQNDLANQLASIGLKLPPEIETKSHTDFAGLFAPALLAASAWERLLLDRDLALLARRALRESPDYVSHACRHLLEFYGSA